MLSVQWTHPRCISYRIRPRGKVFSKGSPAGKAAIDGLAAGLDVQLWTAKLLDAAGCPGPGLYLDDSLPTAAAAAKSSRREGDDMALALSG